MGPPSEVFISHQISSLLELKGPHWFTDSRLLKYQVLLLENPDLSAKVSYLKPSHAYASHRRR